MKRIALLAAAGCLVAVTAQAQQEIAAQPVRIVITKVDCSRLIRHVPAPDVAYQPGVDARGRVVAPADVPGSGADAIPNLLPDVLEIPLTIKPMQGASYAVRGSGDSQAALGTVRYDMARGTFTFNGQPLGSAEQEELARACQKRGVR